MSSFAGYCPYCRKPVMHKTLFGTLHICLPLEERKRLDKLPSMMQQQLQAPNRLQKLLENKTDE